MKYKVTVVIRRQREEARTWFDVEATSEDFAIEFVQRMLGYRGSRVDSLEVPSVSFHATRQVLL